MSTRFVLIDRDTPMLLPVDLRTWLPDGHLVHFILDAVNAVSLQGFKVNARGTGSAQYPPAMMLSLLIYCYATGRMGSRQIEEATHSDVAVRYVCGGDKHPDHDTICAFRRQNQGLFEESFVKVLAYAQELGVLKKRGAVSIDGTKIAANASKHSAVSYRRAGEMIAELEQEVRELVAMAEAADRAAEAPRLDVPAELVRRQDRLAKLQEAKKEIEARFEACRQERQAEYEAKRQAREDKRNQGQRVQGREPQPPPNRPDDKAQYNFTDPESRIMKAGSGEHFEQAYNAQAAVDVEGSLLILGVQVTDAPNDKEQLVPTLQQVSPAVRAVTEVLADAGFFSEKAVEDVESNDGPVVYAAVEKQSHHRRPADLLAKEDPPPPPPEAPTKEKMSHRLRTAAGKAKYALRKQTVEPVFGIIKSAMRFRQFLLRGLAKVSLEWTLVALAYNFKRLFRLVQRSRQPTEGLAPAMGT
jgi:transposase